MTTGMSTNAMVALREASRSYTSAVETVWALRDVTLELLPASFTLVKGASGSGKTTLINVIAGLDDVSSGSVVVDGHDVSLMTQSQKSSLRLFTVGVVFQDHNLIHEFTAVENVMLPLELRGVPRRDAKESALEALDLVGLASIAHRRPADMSGGQRQRVGVARAVVGDRRVLLADEPTGALDSSTSGEIVVLLRKIADSGTAVLVASHDPDFVPHVDRVLDVRDGCVLNVVPA